MKKVLSTIIFLILVGCGGTSAATKPHWLQLSGVPAQDVRVFGVSTSKTPQENRVALISALAAGDILVASEVFEIDNTTAIEVASAAPWTYGHTLELFNATASTTVTLTFQGVTLAQGESALFLQAATGTTANTWLRLK